MTETEVFAFIAFFLFGILIGSFFNVVILRLPINGDIVFTRSQCRTCSTQLKWFENIPLMSFFIQLGKCRHCGAKISLQYPIIEFVYGLSAGVICMNFFSENDSEKLISLSQFFIFSIFIAHFLIDLRHKLLLDSLNIALLIPVLVIVYIKQNWIDAAMGGSIGFVGPLLVTWLFYLLKGQIGLGGGDIKLFGVLGLLFGPMGILMNIMLSCIIGSLITLTLIILKVVNRDEPIPFGPFILIVAAVQIFFPEQLESVTQILFPYRGMLH